MSDPTTIYDAVLAVTGFKRIVERKIVIGDSSAGIPFDVWDGQATIEREGGVDPLAPVVITYDLPYAVISFSVGADARRRMSGEYTRRSGFWSLTYVGATTAQVRWAGELLHDALVGKRLVVEGHRSWLVSLEESQRIRRNDDAVQVNGDPLFYGVSEMAASMTLTKARTVA